MIKSPYITEKNKAQALFMALLESVGSAKLDVENTTEYFMTLAVMDGAIFNEDDKKEVKHLLIEMASASLSYIDRNYETLRKRCIKSEEIIESYVDKYCSLPEMEKRVIPMVISEMLIPTHDSMNRKLESLGIPAEELPKPTPASSESDWETKKKELLDRLEQHPVM